MKQKILIIGSSNVDFVVGVREMPLPGETLMGSSFDNVPGGKGANQACACGRLGGDSVFLSCVGRNAQGDMLLESLRGAHVDTSRMRVLEGVPTGMAFITVNGAGENSIVVIPGANTACDIGYFEANEEAIQEAGIVLAQLETPAEDVYWMLKKAHSLGKLTILNPAPAPESLPEDVLPFIDYLTPNETELAKLTGLPTGTLEEIQRAAQVLLCKGVGHVLVTIGSRGVFLCDREGARQYETRKVTPVDTTAAGDTFNGGFAVGLSEGMEAAEAIRLANAAASLSVTRKGAQTSIPSRTEVEALLADRK